MGYFSIEVKPDVVDGDISDVIAANKDDNPYSIGQTVFDWTAFDIPKGSAKLESVCAYVMGEDGGQQTDTDLYLIFAKTINGNAPASLGTNGAVMSTGFDMPTALVGACKLEGTTEGQGTIDGPAFGQIYVAGPNSANGMNPNGVFTGEPDSGTNVGYDKLYVAGIAGGAIDFSTGILLDMADDADIDASTDELTSITVGGVDPRKCFQVGDTAYVHDVDTQIPGTVASMTSTTITFSETNSTIDIANDDEIINANPIKLILGFER